MGDEGMPVALAEYTWFKNVYDTIRTRPRPQPEEKELTPVDLLTLLSQHFDMAYKLLKDTDLLHPNRRGLYTAEDLNPSTQAMRFVTRDAPLAQGMSLIRN